MTSILILKAIDSIYKSKRLSSQSSLQACKRFGYTWKENNGRHAFGYTWNEKDGRKPVTHKQFFFSKQTCLKNEWQNDDSNFL